MTDPADALPLLSNWRLSLDDRDEIMLVGDIDGEPDGGLLAETKHRERGVVGLRDGRRLELGAPHPAVEANPWAFPPGYEERRLERLKQLLQRFRQGQGPTEAELAAAPLLEAWCYQELPPTFTALNGFVTGHPRLRDGEWIRTSPLIWLDLPRACARTVSRWYRLGQSLPEAISRQG